MFSDAAEVLGIFLVLFIIFGINVLLPSLFGARLNLLVLSKGGSSGGNSGKGFLGGIFGGAPSESPKIVMAPAAAQPAPAAGPTEAEKASAAEEEKKKKQQAAFAAGGTVLTGSLGTSDETVTQKKTLLGT